jgi:hypothetical protein
MYRIEVKKDGRTIRTRHFTTKRKVENYIDDNTTRNPIGAMCDFIVTKDGQPCPELSV